MFQKKCSTCKAEMIGDLHAECESCRAKSAQPVAAPEKKSDTKATFRQIQDMCDKASDHAAYKGDARYKAFLLKAVATLGASYKESHSEAERWDLIVEGRECTIIHRAGRGLSYSVNGKETWDIFGKPE